VDFFQIIPIEYRADLVVLLIGGRPVLTIVIKEQGAGISGARTDPCSLTPAHKKNSDLNRGLFVARGSGGQ
jgi:hypothetical protein